MKGTAGYTPILPSAGNDFWPKFYYVPSRSFPFRKIASLSFALTIVLLFVKFLPRPVPLSDSELQRFWGPYTPYYSVEEYQPPPDGCRVTQASTIHSDA